MELNANFNGRESALSRLLDGSTYPRQKLVSSSLCKKLSCSEMQQHILEIGNAILWVIEPYYVTFLILFLVSFSSVSLCSVSWRHYNVLYSWLQQIEEEDVTIFFNMVNKITF